MNEDSFAEVCWKLVLIAMCFIVLHYMPVLPY